MDINNIKFNYYNKLQNEYKISKYRYKLDQLGGNNKIVNLIYEKNLLLKLVVKNNLLNDNIKKKIFIYIKNIYNKLKEILNNTIYVDFYSIDSIYSQVIYYIKDFFKNNIDNNNKILYNERIINDNNEINNQNDYIDMIEESKRNDKYTVIHININNNNNLLNSSIIYNNFVIFLEKLKKEIIYIIINKKENNINIDFKDIFLKKITIKDENKEDNIVNTIYDILNRKYDNINNLSYIDTDKSNNNIESNNNKKIKLNDDMELII